MNFSELMKTKKDITLGYIGGSITEQKGFRPVFTQYLRDAFPDNNITEINAAMGGTNSFLGVCRIDRDIISKNPDITIIEFSVNDSSEEEQFEFFERTYEGMVRKLLNYKPDMLIIGVGLTTKSMNDSFYEKGEAPYSVKAHKSVCDYYNIPYVNVGEMLFKKIKEENSEMLKYTVDNVHTNDEGGKFYGDALWNSIKEYNFDIKPNEKPLIENNLENATLYFSDKLEKGWYKSAWLRGKIHENYIYSCTPGSEITVDFYGSVFGIYCTTEKTSGNIAYSIDGGEWKERPTWDKYAIDFDRLHYYTLEENLPNKEHSVTIRVSDKKEEQSEGYYLRIIAFLVEKP